MKPHPLSGEDVEDGGDRDDTSKEDEVGINNTVELYMEDDDETETYRLVTSVRGSSVNGLISIDSPLGKAILGHKENDRYISK